MLDTFLLRLRALVRRARVAGMGGLGRLELADRKIVHLDLGLHRTAAQIALMLEWFGGRRTLEIYGFEAHPQYFKECRRRFAGDARVKLFHAALVGPGHKGDTAVLHLDGKKGLGNSLFAARGEQAIAVPAMRLSQFLKDNRIISPGDVVTLRMNIEGAELYVIEDLLEAGMIGAIDGFYGMWDDLYKIDPELDAGFRALLKRKNIRSFPFNDRDLSPLAGPRRRNVIRYDLVTSIRYGTTRKPPA